MNLDEPSSSWPLLLRAAARNAITVGAKLTDEQRTAWDALDDYERSPLRIWARRQKEAQHQRGVQQQVNRDLRVHGEPARRHYAAMSRNLQRTLGVAHLLRAPCEQRHHHRAPRARRRRSSATSSAPTRAGPDSDLSDEPPGERRPLTAGRL
jgi:hypothetical protein